MSGICRHQSGTCQSAYPRDRRHNCRPAASIRPHTHTHTQPFYGYVDFVPDNPGELIPEETFTHSHSSWSSIVPYLLHPSTTIRRGILSVQPTRLSFSTSFSKFSLVYLLGWYPPLHTPYISSPNHCHVLPSQHTPTPAHHRNLLRSSAETTSPNPSLSPNPSAHVK